MQNKFAKTIVHDIAQLIIEIILSKINFNIVNHVKIAINALVLIFIVFYFLNRRIELVHHSCQLKKSS